MKNKRHLAAIVFTDIVGYTAMMEKSEDNALKILREKRLMISSLLQDYGGKHLKEMGDGDLIEFNSSINAVEFVLKFQNLINVSKKFKIRAGIHLGDLVIDNNDMFGSGVNIASRLHGLANPGETIITDSVFSHIKNQSKFHVRNLGSKKVKGLDEKIKIYSVSINKKNKIKNKIRFIDLFIHRRVFQFIGLYSAISWIAIKLIDWLTLKYQYSPYLVDLGLSFAVSMIPTILILSYFHGNTDKKKFNKIEKIVIPANFILSFVFIAIVFYPKDLGAVTKEIIQKDKDGNQIIKTVIKPEFKKVCIVFPFENLSSDSSVDWYEHGMKYSLSLDLKQDMYIKLKNPQYLKTTMGFDVGEILSLPDKKKIADRKLADFFITGSYEIVNDEYLINIEVYEASRANLVNKRFYQSKDFFSIVDQIAYDIKIDVGISENYLNTVLDLPFSEINTKSIEALKNFILGYYYSEYFDDKINYYNNAIEIDPSYAHVYQELNSEMNVHDQEKSEEYLRSALKYINKFTESEKFNLRIKELTLSKKDNWIEIEDKKKKIVETWIEMYPDDVYAYYALFNLQTNTENRINIIKKIINDIEPYNYNNYIWLARTYRYSNQYENALIYFNKFKDAFPKNPDVHYEISKLYFEMLDYEKSKDFLLKARLLGHSGADSDILLSSLNNKLNNLSIEDYTNDILDKLNEYRKKKMTKEIHWQVNKLYWSLIRKYQNIGQIDKAHAYLKEQNDVLGEYNPSQSSASFLIHLIDLFDNVKAKRTVEEIDELMNIKAEVIKNVPYFFRHPFKNFMGAEISYQLGNLDSMLVYLRRMDKFSFFSTEFESMQDYFYVKYYEDTKEYNNALDILEDLIESDDYRVDVDLHIRAGRIYRILGDYEKSNESFEIILDLDDDSAELFYEYALLKELESDIESAKEYISKAYQIYENADEDIELAQNIWKKHKQLN